MHADHTVCALTRAAHGVGIPMAQDGCPYDNALAESVNGQLEGEYALGEAVHKYNHYRPHGSLAMATPAEVHAHPERFARFDMAWGSSRPRPPRRRPQPKVTMQIRTFANRVNLYPNSINPCKLFLGLAQSPSPKFR